MRPRIFIDGEHGTTGLQIRARLAERADVELLSIPEESRRDARLREEKLTEADVAILCLPDEASRDAVATVEASGAATKIIDTSTAFRTAPDWTYGFAEMDKGQAERIAASRRVADPGCYPTGAIGLIRPLRAAGLLPEDFAATVNAVSGYSGGGKQMIAQMEDATRGDHLDAPHFLYGLELDHKHLPEMQVHGLLAKKPVFAPAVGRFAQGMLVQVPLHRDWLRGGAKAADVEAALADHYAGGGTVTVVSRDEAQALKRLDPTQVVGRDTMRLFVFSSADGERLNLVALLDNLGKGASGAAVQNLDLMLGA